MDKLKSTDITKKQLPLLNCVIQLMIYTVFQTLYTLDDIFKDSLGSIAHGDIKPGNLLLSIDTQRKICKLILTDFGTSGPDETPSSSKKSIYAGTKNYLPPNRWNSSTTLNPEPSDQFSTDVLTHMSAKTYYSLLTENSTANYDTDRGLRENGNADDVYAIGVTILELLMSESLLSLDPSFNMTREYKLYEKCETDQIRYEYYSRNCPETLKLLQGCLQKDVKERNELYRNFKTSIHLRTVSYLSINV